MRATRTDGRQRREAILDAALECFAKRGVVGTGIEEIRKRAEASPSSVYHLFGGIEDILLALLERTFERLFEHIAIRVVETKTARAAVETLVAAHVDWVLANPTEARVMYQAMSVELSRKVTAPLAKRKADLVAPIASHLQTFVAKGMLPAWSPLLFDVVALGTAHEACRRFLAGAPLEEAWLRAALPEMAWGAVRSGIRRRAR